MLSIAICDDLSKDRVKLQKDIAAYFADKTEKAEVTTFESGDELLSVITKKEFQIVFMDVYMAGLSGVETSRQLRKMGQDCAIIFTTTSSDHAMAGYEVSASDYLLKPFLQEDVFVALDYAISQMPKDRSTLDVVSERNHIELRLCDIVYIEVFGRESRIHLNSGRVLSVNKPLKLLESSVGEGFIRCHKSYLVNALYILRPTDSAFLLKGGASVPIGAELKADCRDAFFEWSFRRTWENW